MIAGIITPLGNLGALTPQQVCVKPIADVAVSVGQLVKFDLDDTGTGGFANAAAFDDFDNKANPFNVVKLAVAGTSSTTEKGGIWGVVTQAAAAGQRCEVCVAGMVNVLVTGTTTLGVTHLIAGAGVLVPAPSTPSVNSSPALGLALATFASGTNSCRVLFQGFAFAQQSVT